MDVGRYANVTVEEMENILDAIGDAEKSKKVMANSGVDVYTHYTKGVCEHMLKVQFAWNVYMVNLSRTFENTGLKFLVEPRGLSCAIQCCCYGCGEDKALKEKLLNLFKGREFFYLVSDEQSAKLKEDLFSLGAELKRNDVDTAAPVVERGLQEIEMVICNLKNTLLAARNGTVLENIPNDVFHQNVLTRFDYPVNRK